jgi:tetratricopeptide (TPR) repeat protein
MPGGSAAVVLSVNGEAVDENANFVVNMFIGRAELLARLPLELDAGRSLVVVGPPGVGKTRLVRECVKGVVIPLADVSDLGGFVSRVFEVVGTPNAPAGTDAEAEGRLSRALAMYAGVLVLDGFERLPATADALVEEWLRSSRATFCITSRRRVECSAVSIELGPLAVEPVGEAWSEAAVLLRASAAEVARVQLGDEDRDAAHDLVRALDGLPLAIELAAARLGVLTAEQLLSRLPERGLTSAIASSYELLDADAKACLVACAVFRGGIELDALEFVAEKLDVVSALLAVRNHSLLDVVRAGSALRYQLPHSVRDWLVAHAGESEAWRNARRRHAKFWDRRGAELLSDPERLRPEVENLRAAFDTAFERDLALAARLALTLSDPVVALPYAAARAWITQVLEHPRRGELSPGLLGRLHLRSGTLRRFLADFEPSGLDLERARELAAETGDRELEGEALVGLGCNASAQAEWEASRAFLSRSLEVNPDSSARALTLAMIANTHVNQEDHELAEPLLRDSVALAGKHADAFAEAFARLSLGVLLVERGELDEAFGQLVDAMAMIESGRSVRLMSSRHLCAFALTHIARVRQESGDRAGALVDYHHARRIAEEEGARRAEAFVLCGLVGLLLEMGELRAAEDELRVALPLMRENCRDYEGVLVALRGVFFAMQGAKDDSERLFAHAETLLARGKRRVFATALEVLRGRLGELPPEVERFTDVQLARRLRALFSDKTPEKPLLVASDASFFRLSDHEQAVVLGRRKAVRGVLRALVDARSSQPGVPVSVETLVRAGWPGERILPAAAAGRVYTAIATLRRLGLRGVVEQSGSGYLIPPQIPVLLHGDP